MYQGKLSKGGSNMEAQLIKIPEDLSVFSHRKIVAQSKKVTGS